MAENRTSKNMFWKMSEKMGNQLVNFIITVILARILGPSEYGIVALLSIFITFATVIVQDGFNVTLIRRRRIDDDEYKSSLYFSLIIALFLYVTLYITSPLIAEFYKTSSLESMLKVLSIILFPAAINSIQTAYLTKKFQFKPMFFCNFSATILSGIISVIFAFLELKAWAIILNQLLYQILSCIFICVFCKWRPKGRFSKEKLTGLVGFGSKMLFTSLLINLFLNVRSLLIGKFYSSKDLGNFNRGKSFSSTLMEGINGSIQSVLLPTYAKIQDNHIELKQSVRKSIHLSCYLIFPALIGLVCIADPLINVLLGKEWLQAIPFVQLFALTYIFQPTQISTAQALKAIEKGNVILIVEMLRKSFELVLLIITLFKGPIYIAFTGIVSGIFAIIITYLPNRKYLNYSISEQISDFLNPLFDSFVMGIIILLINHFVRFNYIILLIIDIISGILSYILISKVRGNENFIFLKKMIFDYLKN